MVFGLIVVLVGVGILTGLERELQAWLISITPEWLLNLATRY
jgi:hypothetical protein